MKRDKILIADDNKINRGILCEILSCSYEIFEAENGSQALAVIESENIDAVIIDLIMPVMDGYEFLKELKARPEFFSIPVMVTTQREDFGSELSVLELGATEILTMPFEPAAVRRRLANILQLRETTVLRNTAERDFLTKLFNKETFYKKAQELIINNLKFEFAIITMDIDKFKLINDIYGTKVGDKLLRFIADEVQKYFSPNNAVCGRLGGDNFAVCCNINGCDWEKIADDFAVMLDNYPLNIKINLKFGIYIITNRALPLSVMCDRANLAIKLVKGRYQEKFSLYNDRHRLIMLEEQEITNEMHNALLNGQFTVYFQPKFDLTTEKIVGAEALTRWVHPQKGIISPDKFIPLFERNGFITELDAYIWELTCSKLRSWIDVGNMPVPVSVNISRVDIYNPNLCNILSGLIEKYNIPIKLFELEITETAYTEKAEQVIEMVNKLKNMGFTVQMDDFGSGYSSLNMLNEIKVDVIKIDMRFLQNKKSGGHNGVLSFVVGLAKWMGIPVVAEGIETQEQAAFLRGMGCNVGQGYYFSKPLPQEEFEKILKINIYDPQAASDKEYTSLITLDEIWDPFSHFNILFNNYVGALSVYEYIGGKLSLIRGNDRYYSIVGSTREEGYMRGMNVLNYCCDEDREDFVAMLEKVKNEKTEISFDSRWHVSGDNRLKWFHTRVKVIFEAEGRTVFFASMEDISQKKELEERLRYQHDFYQQLYDTVPCGIAQFSTGKGTKFINANIATLKILGYTAEEFWSDNHFFDEFICSEYYEYAYKKLDSLQSLELGSSVVLEYEIINKKGERLWIRDFSQIIKNQENEICYQCVLTDITEQKLKENDKSSCGASF